MLHPVQGVALLAGGDHGEGRVQQVVAGWGGVEEDQVFEVGVDAVFHGQVHEHGPGDRPVQGESGHVNEFAVVVTEQKEKDFFRESEHAPPPWSGLIREPGSAGAG